MAEYSFQVFAANNLTNPQNPGFLPAEDSSYRSDLNTGDQITWTGGGESVSVTVIDPTGTTFDEAQSNQTLKDPVTFDGISYSAGQVVTPTYTIVFSGSDGQSYTMTSFNFSPNTGNEVPDGVFWEGAKPPAGTVLTVTSEINPTASQSRPFENFVTCFCAGTLVETSDGLVPVEALTTEHRLRTQSGRFEPVVMVCDRCIGPVELAGNAKLRPVRIRAGALGAGLPERDLWVSRQHRLCVSSAITERMFELPKVLVSAIQLAKLPGIAVDWDVKEVRYVHVLLPQHEVIFAEGALTESLYLGRQTINALSEAAREEVFAIFPELRDFGQPPQSALHIPALQQQKKLVERHLANAKPLVG